MKRKNLPVAIFIGVSLLIISLGPYFYQMFYAANLCLAQERASVFIRPGDDISAIVAQLKKHGLLENETSFRFVAKTMKYDVAIKPGHYVLSKKMSNIEAVRMLRGGKQVPVRVTFNNARTKADLAEKIAPYLIAESDDILRKMNDNAYLKEYGFDSLNIVGMFLPNTYEMYWTTDADGLFKRMKREYDRFWSEERRQKAEALGMTPQQVTTLASIVQAETIKNDEKPRVAGAYLNRMKIGMPLQADPTVVFALQDFEIRRVLTEHLAVDSPYNTYKHTGLPPGPINVPSPNSIDAVLNKEEHKYIFFCAKEDFSGYHNFAETLSQHNKNAEKYRKALNAKGIR